MADNDKTTSTTSQKTDTAKTSETPTAEPRRTSRRGHNRDALRADEQRIDPRLDNRQGSQRPKLETFPAKPQQIDGPELGEEPRPGEVRAHADLDEKAGPRKGMRSPGPHGLGDTADQV
jgi:hypothetical protein